VIGFDDDSVGVQCATEGVMIAAGAASVTIVQRQCVRVGAATAAVEKRKVVAKSEAADVTSMLCGCDASSGLFAP
jgi:hypothetical protein